MIEERWIGDARRCGRRGHDPVAAGLLGRRRVNQSLARALRMDARERHAAARGHLDQAASQFETLVGCQTQELRDHASADTVRAEQVDPVDLAAQTCEIEAVVIEKRNVDDREDAAQGPGH